MEEEFNETPEVDTISENETKCASCGSSDVVDGHSIPLCADCRRHFTHYPVPAWIKIMSVVILAVMVVALIQFPKSIKAGIAFERGKRAEDAKKYSTAAKEYKKVIEIFPDSFIAKGKLFVAYVKNGQIENAENAFEQIKGKKSTDADEKEIIKEANDALNTLDSYYNLNKDLSAILDNEKNDGLEVTYKKLTDYSKKNPKDFNGYFYLGDVLYEQGNYKDAQAAYMKAVQLKPELSFARLSAAAAYRQNKEFDKAIAECNKVLESNAESSDAYASLGKIDLKRHEYKSALEYAKKAYEYDNSNIGTMETLALAYHFNNMASERDETLNNLKSLKDPYISKIQDIIDGKSKIYE